MAERALVTGGAGFIGVHTTAALLAAGVEVTLLDDLSRGEVDAELTGLLEHCRLVRWDLTRPLPDDLLAGSFDTVYHLAAIVGVHTSLTRPYDVARVNVAATVNLLDWCERRRPARLFVSSTSEVGDGAGRSGLSGFPVPEHAPVVIEAPLAPRSSYATSKLMSEVLVAHAGAGWGTAVTIGRYHNVYGPRMGRAHVIPQFIDRIGQDPFLIYGARQRRCFCFVSDAVAATLAATACAAARPGEALLVNIGDDTAETEIADLARQLFALAGVDPALDPQPPPDGSPDRRLPDLTRLRAAIDYQPRIDLATGLARTVGWYRPELLDTGLVEPGLTGAGARA